MIQKKILLLILIFFIIIISGVDAISVGISPYMTNLGVIEPGSSRIVKFNLITGTPETILVYLSSERGDVHVFSSIPILNNINIKIGADIVNTW